MTTIEDKINLFSKIVYEKVNEEKEERLKIFNQEAQKKLIDQKNKINGSRKDLRAELEKKYSIKANEIIAREKLNRQRAVLLLKDELIKNTMLEVEKKLLEFADSKEYEEYFLGSLKKVMDNLEDGDYYLVILQKDLNKFSQDIEKIKGRYADKNVEVKISETDMIGGVIIEDLQGRFKLDNSLYSKLEGSRELAGIRVMEMLA